MRESKVLILCTLRENDVTDNHPTSQEAQLSENIARVRQRIAEAALRVGRSPDEVTLVAVSKTKPIELVKIAYHLGVRDFGENRVQEALLKIDEFRPQDIRWHMIGHLQSNKAGKVAGAFAMVQSVDGLHLAQTLNRHAEQHSPRLPVLLEVNVAGEATKAGMLPDETVDTARQIVALPQLEVQGLMTVAPLVENAEEVRWVFRRLRLLRDELRQEIPEATWHHLSMGMTDDFPIAIEEGATIVRVGRAIFGERENRQQGNREGH